MSVLVGGWLLVPELNTLNGILILINFLQLPAALKEALGKNVPYSKFANQAAGKKQIASRWGMMIIYGPAMLAAMWAMSNLCPDDIVSRFKGQPVQLWNFLFNSRPLLVSICLWLHFLKRELEVLTVHSYSGTMEQGAASAIAVAYCMYTSMISWNFLPNVPAELWARTAHVNINELGGRVPIAVLVGLTLFVVGQYGNLFHHRLLAALRPEGDKKYAIPAGGLFGVLVCPHYVFELIAWYGMAIMSQHLYVVTVAGAMTAYLLGRTIATRAWYHTKFDDFPKNRKLLIPFIF